MTSSAQLSAPVHQLKRKAKIISRKRNMPFHAALDLVAAEEGFNGWSHLATASAAATPAQKIFPRLVAGDMLLLGARPGQGKTRFSLELAIEAMKAGRRSLFFTLEYTGKEVAALFDKIGAAPADFGPLFTLDSSDGIHAGYIVDKLAGAQQGAMVVVDYLQLLDQKRGTPPLAEQVKRLKDVAAAQGLIFVFISQIDRSYDPAVKPLPDISDLRLPNPLDIALFSKTCFMHGKEWRFRSTGEK